MSAVVLCNTTPEGKKLQASFLPHSGMNLISYKKEEIEALDQTTKSLFEERFAGLGALIGPHFHHRQDIPEVPFEQLFPHIARVKAKGVKEPFSHGIARYAPWEYKATEDTISAHLSGNHTWNGVLLSVLEGFYFEMYLDVQLKPDGLFLELSVEAEKPSVVGLHYYYALPSGAAFVRSSVQDLYHDGDTWKKIPQEWLLKSNTLRYPVGEAADFGFRPLSQDDAAEIWYETSTHSIKVSYQANNNENSWQLFHPKGASYVCIEPLSAKNPRQPVLTSSSLSVKIEIF